MASENEGKEREKSIWTKRSELPMIAIKGAGAFMIASALVVYEQTNEPLVPALIFAVGVALLAG